MSGAQGVGVLALLLLVGAGIVWGLFRLEERLYRRNFDRESREMVAGLERMNDAAAPPARVEYTWSDLAADYRRNFPNDIPKDES